MAMAYALWVRTETTTEVDGSKPTEIQRPAASTELTQNIELHERSSASEALAASSDSPKSDLMQPASELEGWRHRRLKEVEKAYEDLRKVVERDVDSLQQMQHVLVLSIVPIMDELGLAITPRQGVYEVTQPSGDTDNYFTFRGKRYKFARGMFPPYDRMMELWTQQEKTANEQVLPPGTPPPKRRPFDVDERLLNEIEQLKNQAQGAIERRQDPY